MGITTLVSLLSVVPGVDLNVLNGKTPTQHAIDSSRDHSRVVGTAQGNSGYQSGQAETKNLQDDYSPQKIGNNGQKSKSKKKSKKTYDSWKIKESAGIVGRTNLKELSKGEMEDLSREFAVKKGALKQHIFRVSAYNNPDGSYTLVGESSKGNAIYSKRTTVLPEYIKPIKITTLPTGQRISKLEEKSLGKEVVDTISAIPEEIGSALSYIGRGILFVASNMFCCSNGEDPYEDMREMNDNEDDDDDTFDWNNDGCTTKYPEESKYNIVECTDRHKEWKCDRAPRPEDSDGYQHLNGGDCTQDYFNFFTKSSEEGHSIPISQGELEEQLDSIKNGEVELIFNPMTEEELTNVVKDSLNNQFLREDINDRELRVIEIDKKETDLYIKKTLLFQDPWVGEFKAIFTQPKVQDQSKVPGIVMLHGHCGCGESYWDSYGGREYARRGFATIIPTQRAMCLGDSEDRTTRSGLRNGTPMYGIRNYEALLCKKYLQSRESIGDSKIGAIGHSGGSCHLSLMREGEFDALVIDNGCDYFGYALDGEDRMKLHDDNIPWLYPYNYLIQNNFPEETPTLMVPYGYEYENTGQSSMPQIFDFFEQNLRESSDSENVSLLYNSSGRKIGASGTGKLYDSRGRLIAGPKNTSYSLEKRGRELALTSRRGPKGNPRKGKNHMGYRILV